MELEFRIPAEDVERAIERTKGTTVEDIRRMTPEQRAEYIDSLPESVRETMRKIAELSLTCRERAAFEAVRQELGEELGKTLGDECLEQDSTSTFGVPNAYSFSTDGGKTWKPLVNGSELR